jgi:hypothetical protein
VGKQEKGVIRATAGSKSHLVYSDAFVRSSGPQFYAAHQTSLDPNYPQATLIRDLEEQGYLRPQSGLKGELP